MLKHLFSLFILGIPVLIFGQQTELRPVTSTIALTNATIVTKPGTVIEGASIVIKDGLIQNVGQNISLPADAQVIKTDSLYIYPGFIDGMSHAGVVIKEDDNERPKAKPGKVPNDLAGITPERSVSDMYSKDENSISSLREVGYTITHTVPKGKMLPGKGSILLLNAKPKARSLLQEDVSVFSQFKPASGMAPATTIGVIAKWKDLYNQAKDGSSYEKAFQTSQSGMKRPDYNDAVRGLYSVVNKSTPVFFKAEKRYDIYRAMSLANELGFDIVLANVKQGWDNIENIKKAKGILLSLDLPKADKEEKKDSTKKVDEEFEALKLKSKQSKLAYTTQAAMFEKENVDFAFSSVGVKSKDILPNLRRMIENGLSEEAALVGLTTAPAKLLGISSVAGTLEKGKIANLVITTKPIFDEKTKIKYVFVDGEKFEYETKKKKKKSGGDPVAIEGSWKYDIDIPGMAIEGVMDISKVDDGVYNFKMKNTSGMPATFEALNKSLEDNSVTFDTTVDAGGDTTTVSFELDFEEADMEGTITVPDFGTFPITASKTSPK